MTDEQHNMRRALNPTLPLQPTQKGHKLLKTQTLFFEEQHQKSVMPTHNCWPTTTNSQQPTTNNTTTSIGGFLAAFLGTDAFTDTDLYAESFCHRISQVIAHVMDVDGSFFCRLDDMAPSSVGSMTKFSYGEEGTAVVRKQSR
jgi:hypothetical protein